MDNWWQVKEREFARLDIDLAEWQAKKPFGISGCFRVRNDYQFLEQAVMSHLPYLDEAVIVVQPSNFQTEKVVQELAKVDKVRVVRYPFAPVFITEPAWEQTPINSITSFVYVSNWAFAQCRFSHIARIEGDVICLSSFAKVRAVVESNPDRKCLYGRVLLNVAGINCDMISLDNPRNGGWDECVVPNHPEYHFTFRPRYEVLESPHENECMGWSGLHMKRCKLDKIGWNDESYLPFDPEHVQIALGLFNGSHTYPGPDNPGGEPCLFELS